MTSLTAPLNPRKPPSVKTHCFDVTFFKDPFAKTLEVRQLSLPGLRDLVLQTQRSTKAKLPWCKLATFGDVRTNKGSLRHDANMLAINGIELDYDKEQYGLRRRRNSQGDEGSLSHLHQPVAYRSCAALARHAIDVWGAAGIDAHYTG